MLGWLPRQLKILSSVNGSFSLADDPNPFESGKKYERFTVGNLFDAGTFYPLQK